MLLERGALNFGRGCSQCGAIRKKSIFSVKEGSPTLHTEFRLIGIVSLALGACRTHRPYLLMRYKDINSKGWCQLRISVLILGFPDYSQAAIQGQARILLSEDLPDGQFVEDLKILNPFSEEWKDYL